MAREVARIPVGSTTLQPVEKSLKRLLPAPVGCQSPDVEPRATKQCKTSTFLLLCFFRCLSDICSEGRW